jgi:hypothetical protein
MTDGFELYVPGLQNKQASLEFIPNLVLYLPIEHDLQLYFDDAPFVVE